MSIFQKFRSVVARAIAPAPTRRSFQGAQVGRLYANWIASATSADSEIRRDIRKLIDRSRDLERNNDYQRGFLLSAQRNINGSHKMDLRSDAGEWVFKKGGVATWQADQMAKRMIEDAWAEWGKAGACTVDRRRGWRDVRRLAVRSVIRDGNFIARKIVGKAAGNRFGFALQLWEIDHLDLLKFQPASRTANEIRFGIEYDSQGAPIAYWLRARHPGDYFGVDTGSQEATRFPAEEIYHLFVDERAEQSVGYPWVVSAITRLRQLGAFEEAAVIAARLGASKVGFFKKVSADGRVGSYDGETTSNGRAIIDGAPGTFEELPEGWALDQWSPEYPNIETGEFRKAMLRGVCSSLGCSYTTLGNDLESVNFSSARVGIFDEREGWKDLQLFFSEGLWERIFADWLEAAIMNGAINLPLGKFAKFNRPVFKARRWAFIDPLKETEAAKSAIALRINSRRSIIEDQGGDVEDVFHDNLDDEQLAEDIGLELPDVTGAPAGQMQADQEDPTDQASSATKKPTAAS